MTERGVRQDSKGQGHSRERSHRGIRALKRIALQIDKTGHQGQRDGSGEGCEFGGHGPIGRITGLDETTQ